jgi:signal transduction histidine kinase
VLFKEKMIRLKLSSKILLYFLIVSLLPLVVVSYLLVTSADNQLLSAVSERQQAVAVDLTDRVDNYLNDKIERLVYQAETYSAGNLTPTQINQNLAVLFNQDKDIQSLAILNVAGQDQVAFDKSGQVNTPENQSDSDAFKAVNFLSGKNYVSSVSYNSQHEPLITIAVPVLTSNYIDHLNDLSGASFGTYTNPSDIKGSIIANYNISDLWQSVLSTKIGKGGYAYVVDGLGNLVAHPNSEFLATHQKLSNVQAVKQFIDGDLSTSQTISETGQVVISTPRVVSSSGWAVIVEEPISSIYSGINSYIRLAATIGIIAIILSFLLSIFFRRQITEPIRKLSVGAKKLGAGEFDYLIKIKSKDELKDLADTFNKMGFSIKKLVSDLKVNNLNLQVEQTKLNNIIRSVSDGIIALNAKGEIVTINPPAAKLVNKKSTDLQGKIMTSVFSWEMDDKPFMPELKQPGLYHYSNLVISSGTTISYLDLMVSVIDSSDSDAAVIITIHDLTQSRELDFMKLDFVAIAAHELRTPVTVVRGYLDMLNPSVVNGLTINDIETLQKAIRGTNQLRDLINKLLNIAKIERGEMEIFIEKMDLVQMVRDNVNQHESAASQKEQRITFKANTNKHVYVPADPSSLTEVLNNLIGNAIKFTSEGGEIKVTLTAAQDMVKVEVTDNGPGVPNELRSKLFTKFYRAERSMISGARGTGLGLFISKTIIQLQQGEIGIEPDTGKGSTFYFTLPVYKAEKHDKLISKEKQPGRIRGWFKKRDSR